MPNIYLPGAIWRRLVSCDGFGCFVRCDREEARVDAVLRTLQKHLRCTHCTAAAAFHTTGSHRASRRRWGRDLDRFGLSRYFLSPAQWNIIWGDKAGITHNFLVFSSEQHSPPVSTHVGVWGQNISNPDHPQSQLWSTSMNAIWDFL